MYIVASPSLVAACDRRAKVVSFAPYVVQFGKRVLAASRPAVELLSEDILGEKGASKLRLGTMQAMHDTLKPGKSLKDIRQATLKDLIKFLGLGLESEDRREVPLFDWTRRFMTEAATNAIYGSEKNPMKDPEVYNGFWYEQLFSANEGISDINLILYRAVDKSLALLGLMIMPDLIAPEASRGRTRFFNAFKEYYATGGLETASSLVKERYKVNSHHAVSDEDIARFDLGLCTALLVNTAPSIFWTLCHLYSNSMLLAEIRDGIEAEVYRRGKGETIAVNIPDVMKAFPLLESLVREILRVQSTNASARFLLKDTVINDEDGTTYLLKKDSFLAMPSRLLHISEAVWGPGAETVDPRRFLKERQHAVPASANRTFGGGNSLCPGRHLAMDEIMSTLIIIILKYDIEPVGTAWRIPEAKHHLSTSILTPVSDISVRIRLREEVRNVEFSFAW
ncbi:cytochrome P450 [Daldinia caldariorum]|uniref:cytochrome P450 n=1 Tax=Daldinia caldariorum TaxID=326644 RepID=UPI002008A930|nr:cytochrome P450 [Daldinia caldariorum]KAI1469808.1 cytochrome P450 [Daldinia caldariorum]